MYWILLFSIRVKLNWLAYNMGYAILGSRFAIAEFPEGEFDENISELISYLTSSIRMAIIHDVDLHRCRHPLAGTPKQLNGIEA